MSSMRNAVQRRPHKERAQPHGREKWGILEKHKDYSLRARDFNVKKAKLKALREKAAARNEDEFYFGMVRGQAVQGQKVGDRGNRAMPVQEVAGLKTQDAAYLRTMLHATKREIEKIEGEIQLLERGDNGPEIVTRGGEHEIGKHTVFVGDAHEQADFSAHEWFDTDENGLNKGFNRPRVLSSIGKTNVGESRGLNISRKKRQEEQEAARQAARDEKKRLSGQEIRLRRLDFLRKQAETLEEEEREVDEQRAKMNGTATSGVNKKGVAFKIRERKR